MDAPIENYVEADAPIENDVEADAPIENDVEADAPIENDVEADAPIENDVEADVSVAVDAADVADMEDMAEKAVVTEKADMANMTDMADIDNMNEATENLNDQKRERDDDVTAGVSEKRWPGWPGESVFRILVPSQKVGGIIGRKGESIKRLCEESRARIKILDGPQSAPERAVLFADLDNIQIFVLNQNRRTKIQFSKSSL